MKEKTTILNYKGRDYRIVFNLNVIQALQIEYGSYEKWGELTEGKNSEIDVKALIFGIKEMLNEAIDIDNDNYNDENKTPFLTEKQVGRIITEIGIKEISNKLRETVVESTKDDSSKN